MDGEGETPRLFILSAGNTRDPNASGFSRTTGSYGIRFVANATSIVETG